MTTTGVVWIKYRYAQALRYDPASDCNYAFPAAAVAAVAVKAGGLTLPQLPSGGSVLLRVWIESDFLGHFLEPSLEIAAGGRCETQYFEKGVSGIRYVNITPAIQDGQTAVSLAGRHLRLHDAAQVLTFPRIIRPDSKILILSPHPDDAELAAFSLFGRQTTVVTVTAGDAGDNILSKVVDDPNKSFYFKGLIRSWNSCTVPALGGVPAGRAINLGYFNRKLFAMRQDADKATDGKYVPAAVFHEYRNIGQFACLAEHNPSPSWNSLLRDLRRLIEDVRPDVVVAPHPTLDSHPDHRAVTLALGQALADVRHRIGQVLLYTNHPLSPIFPFGKRQSILSLAPHLDPPLVHDAVLSVAVAPDALIRKTLALDAMNDLRRPIDFNTLKSGAKALLAGLGELAHVSTDRFRRDLQRNELFYVLDCRDDNCQSQTLLAPTAHENGDP